MSKARLFTIWIVVSGGEQLLPHQLRLDQGHSLLVVG